MSDLVLNGGTRRVVRLQETEYAALSSVELCENSKGEVKVSSVKVYGLDVEEAGEIALRTMTQLKAKLEKEG